MLFRIIIEAIAIVVRNKLSGYNKYDVNKTLLGAVVKEL